MHPPLVLLVLPALAAAQLNAPLPGLNATGFIPTQGLVTLVTTVPSFRTFIPSPTVVVYGGRTWSVAAAPATLTISEGCPCAVTTTRCLGPDCYYKGPDVLPDQKAAGSGGVVILGTGTGAGARATGTNKAGGGSGGQKGEDGAGAGGQQKGHVGSGEGKKAMSGAGAGAKAGEVVFGVVAGVVLGGVLMVL